MNSTTYKPTITEATGKEYKLPDGRPLVVKYLADINGKYNLVCRVLDGAVWHEVILHLVGTSHIANSDQYVVYYNFYYADAHLLDMEKAFRLSAEDMEKIEKWSSTKAG